MWMISKRNCKLFFRDKSAVFFSLLAVFIVIGLYVLFLGDTITSGMEGVPSANFLIDSWIMAGLLAVTSYTTTLGAFGTMVDDRAKKVLKDFTVSPLRRSSLAGGYIVSSCFVGLVMTLVTFLLAEAYIALRGGELLTLTAAARVLGLILLSVLSNSAMLFFIVSFFKSQNAFSALSTVIGTLIGFLTGVYIPIGNLPSAVQAVIKVFPPSHAGALFRQVMLERPLSLSFAGAPQNIVENFENEMGVTYSFGGQSLSLEGSLLILIGSALLFYGLSILIMRRKER